MALYITVNKNNTLLTDSMLRSFNKTAYHVGADLSNFALFVDEIQVDNTELEYIRENIPGLPIPNKRVVKFYGDTAKMIVGNLFD